MGLFGKKKVTPIPAAPEQVPTERVLTHEEERAVLRENMQVIIRNQQTIYDEIKATQSLLLQLAGSSPEEEAPVKKTVVKKER